jgi:nicotinamidase-related amidase
MKALLVIDMQVACFDGLPPRLEEEAVVGRINALVRAMRGQGLVIWIQHTDPAEGFARDSAGWQMLPSLDVGADDLRVEKEACDSFLETALKQLLDEHKVRELIITGCATDYCVDTTVKAAASLGYEVTVAADAHTTRDRPQAAARTLIAHYNYVWSDLLLPRGRRIKVVPTAALLG